MSNNIELSGLAEQLNPQIISISQYFRAAAK